MVVRTGGDLVKKTTVVILLAALGMALAASCGTSAKEQLQSYVTDCKPQVESMVKTMGGLQNPFSSMSQTKDATWDTAAATLDSAVTAIQGAADGLGSITAPDALKTVHDQLIVGLEDVVKAFRTIGSAIKDGSFGNATMNDAALNKLLDDGTAKRKAWKTALEKQCKDLGVTITWKWE
jgi:hypothetical protein